MDRISELRSILGEVFAWNKCRLDCLTKMLVAMFIVRTVNLREIAVAFSSDAKIESRYMRLKRFFKYCDIDYTVLARWIFKLFFSDHKKLYLTIDRTNWYWGKSKINVFMLSIAHEGVSIPLLWTMLDKAGNASANEHIQLIEKFLCTFDKSYIVGILGDREFASEKLFRWCIKQKIPFYIRIKDNADVRISKKKICSIKDIFKHLNPKEQTTYKLAAHIYNCKIYLGASRSERGELMVVATNQPPKNAVAIYLRRWEIECLFSCLKGRGFRFESTHITKLERIEKLVAVLAIAFCWAHKVGEWQATIKPITTNKYKDARRPQFSFFRYGLDKIRDTVIHFKDNMANICSCLTIHAHEQPIMEMFS